MLWPRSFFRALAFRRVIKDAPEGTIFYVREGLLVFPLTLLSYRFRRNFFYEMHSFVRHYRFVYKLTCYFARGVISTSESKTKILVDSFGVSHERILTAPNVIDPTEFSNMPSQKDARDSLRILSTNPVIIFTGRPSALRGINLILELALRMKDRATFICVGGAQGEIDRLRGKSGFDEVTFIPFVPHKDIMRYMASADILIAPQSGHPEFKEVSKHSSPIKVLEYMATGIPSLFSRIPAIEKIVAADEGVFADPDSVEDWLKKIQYILDHYTDVQKKAIIMRDRAIECTWDARAKSIADFIDRYACK
ncbi:MAG: glycosyltransferase [Candidatus Ryanbacteria bacterium]|nr:glycosyltransferase [Candidatus Ryanbacteria bacterium]